MKKFTLFLILFFGISLQAAEETRLLRFPATNGQTVVFTYAGDLYKVPVSGGIAQKLTNHVGFEMFAKFSPNGEALAFTGQYDGNTEVYTLPLAGGEPKRITYTATLDRDDVSDRMGPNNIVMAWTPDGREVVFRSRMHSFGFRGYLYKAPAEGGLFTQVPLPEGGFCSYSPNGQQLAYNRVFREFRTWKYYQGGMADDVWIHDFSTRKTVNVTNHKAQDIFPMWIGKEIFFLSDRDRTMNLFVYNTETQKTEKITQYTDFDIKFPSHHGTTIVFEKGGSLFVFDAVSRSVKPVPVTIKEDFIYARHTWKDVSGQVSSAALSPNGERALLTARGDVFSVPSVSGVTRNITNTSGAHERSAQWSPNGEWIAYISDLTGETELYLQPNDLSKRPIVITSKNDTYISSFKWSPDSKQILYTDRKNRLQVIDITSRKTRLILTGEIGGAGSPVWSPDSRWLAYSLTERNQMDVIYLYHLESGKQYPVTDKWYNSGEPAFSQDGKYLFFISERDFNPTYGSTEWNHVYNNMDKLYMAILSNETPSPFAIKDDEVKVTSEAPADSAAKAATPSGKSAASGAKSEKEATKAIVVHPEGILDRILALPVEAGGYRSLYGASDKLYYVQKGSVKVFDLTKKAETVVVEGGSYAVSPNGKKMLVIRGRNFSVVDMPSGKVSPDKNLDLSDLKVLTDYREEWGQIFDASWRYMRDGFYVTNMHGVDWPAMKKKYIALLPYVRHRADLTYLIGEMISELNVGHAYVNSGEMPKPERIQTGLLGARLDADPSGYPKIGKIYRGVNWSAELRSPLTEPGINGKEGEFILAINGVSTKMVANPYQLLVGQAGKKVELLLGPKPDPASGRKVIVTPLASEVSLVYYNWVQDNIKKVEEATNCRVGYLHIPDMGIPGLNEFAKYFYPQLDKEALIIDDRTNGGGNVSPMILERLARIPYRATAWRHSSRPGTVPDKTLVGPKVVLIDKYSMSDGDLFPHGFRALGLGKLIGTRTWGGIVGISSSLPFLDGAELRVPMFTSYSPETGEWIIEGYGVDPDIEVDNDPAKEWDGEDEQLNRAIQEMLEALKSRKGLPPIPSATKR